MGQPFTFQSASSLPGAHTRIARVLGALGPRITDRAAMSDKVANLLLKQLIRHNILYRGSLEAHVPCSRCGSFVLHCRDSVAPHDPSETQLLSVRD